MVDGGCGVDGFGMSGVGVNFKFCVSVGVGRGGRSRDGDGVRVGEHDPDCVECNCEKVGCEEERGWCDSG